VLQGLQTIRKAGKQKTPCFSCLPAFLIQLQDMLPALQQLAGHLQAGLFITKFRKTAR
jgi:hypothetical protein